MNPEEDKIITFKLFVFKNQKNLTEIRKFNLKSTDITFEKIEETLLDIFPDLKQLQYKILWKDQEDFVTFSTAKEFSVFKNHATKSETNEDVKFFINFEDELFAVSQKFEQCKTVKNLSCNICHNNLTLTCLNCTMSKESKSEQEVKILNVTKQAKQPPLQFNFSDKNSEANTFATFAGFNGINSTKNALSGKALRSTPRQTLKQNSFSPDASINAGTSNTSFKRISPD